MKRGDKSKVQKSEILQDILEKMRKRNSELEEMEQLEETDSHVSY